MAGAKVPVILLAEIHNSEKCNHKNVQIIGDILATIIDTKEDLQKVLLVSEGHGLNECYLPFLITLKKLTNTSLPIIREYESDIETANEMLEKFILYTQLSETIAQGIVIKDHLDIVIDKEWLLRHMDTDGFKELLMRSEDAYKRYKQALDAAERKDIDEYFRAITDVYKQIEIKMPDFKALIRQIIEANGKFAAATELFMILTHSRENNIIARVEEHIHKQPSIETVIIIFGRDHYDDFVKLISRSPLLTLDARSSNALEGGGRRRKRKTHRRKHIKRKSTRSKR